MKDVSLIDFDTGRHYLSQNTTGIAFNKYFEDIASGLSLAFDIEYRTKNFGVFEGEIEPYALYDDNGVVLSNPATQTVATDSDGNVLPGGSQGFPEYSPDNEIEQILGFNF